MRFGKRRKPQSGDEPTTDGPLAPDSVTADWAAGFDHSMPPPDPSAAPAPEPVVDPETPAPEPEAVLEGEAVELPYEPPAVAHEPVPQPAAAAFAAPAYEPGRYEPPAPHPVVPEPAARLSDSTPHHEPGRSLGSCGAWPEPAFDLAERPEILVGAAFGGGLLLALILRRLGH